MGLLSPILTNVAGNRLTWWCPGCKEAHQIKAVIHQPAPPVPDPEYPDYSPLAPYYIPNGPAWGWNGDVNKPTFTPSVDVKSGHYASAFEGSCWCTYNAEQIEKGLEPSGYSCQHCHCFVVDGQIQFLSDCTHALASQTVDIPPWPRQD